jgi:hypothetical protein
VAFARVFLFAMLLFSTDARAAVHAKGRTHARTTSPTASPTSNATSGASAAAVAASTLDTGPSSTLPTSVLFDGTLPTSWWLNQSATPTRVQMVADPAGTGGTAQQFTTYNTDVAPLTPTANPRSQLTGPTSVIKRGGTYWQSYEVYVPTSDTLPTNPSAWIGLGAVAYGAPFAGSPPVGLSIFKSMFRFQRNAYAPEPWQIAWTAPVVKGQWYRFTWHYLFSATGWVELYVNDVQVGLRSAATTVKRLPIAMIDATDNKGPWEAQEQLYYQLNAMPSAQIYFKNYKIATTQLAAES